MCSSESGKDDNSAEEDNSSPEPSNMEFAANEEAGSSQSQLESSAQFKAADIRTTGGGLSAAELQELHKTDPKKVKRILANRSSAARSKVRKLRYIAELDSKSSSLHQQVSEMTAELRALQEGTSRLGAENEWLVMQIVNLQEKSLRLDQEIETMQLHITQSRNLSRVLSGPKQTAHMRAHPPDPSPSRLPPLPLEAMPRQNRLQIPVSAFQGHMQDPRGQPLLGMQSQGSPGKFQQESYRQMPQQQGELLPALPPHLHAEQAVAFDRNFGGATLQSYNSSEGSGMSTTTQELRLGPEDPALLDLLRSFDLGTPRMGRIPSVPLPPNSLARYDRSLSLGMLPPRRSQNAFPSTQLQQRLGDMGHGMPAWQNIEEARRLSSLAPQLSAATSVSGQWDGGQDAPLLPQGLGRWPRHFSDPQAIHRGPYTQ